MRLTTAERLILIENKLQTHSRYLYVIAVMMGINLGIPLIPMAAAMLG